MSDKLILVDKEDNIIGHEEKVKCHLGDGKRHRAFSVFIFNDNGELLIHKRSEKKMLWPGFWANSCCSHPREGEDRVDAAERRLVEELGFTCKLKLLFKYKYKAKFGDVGSENEYNAVLVGNYDGELKVNPDEISEFKWVGLDWLKKDMIENREIYAPWFLIGFKFYVKNHQSKSGGIFSV